ncbi:hypothetical protein HZH66_003276 [Vespula vulgaris]|uniref:Phenylalanine--tRNA ligase beta subunit n=1 Tax=Vespula vulgaris TaxID=7454 RepID=A0A834NI64_VESVU|nr:phenylalanine--tRNA ligase beta subunit [Vespula vulgaris]KAF7408739.1 hypothetical protein HZH66_003276 [Vespula vulgaris]
MPTIAVKRDLLFKALGKTYSEEEFQNLCFEFGLELDDVTTEKQMIAKEQGSEQSTGASEEIIYKIDIPANRYDLLSLEGLVTGLLVFLNKTRVPCYNSIKPMVPEEIVMKKECLKVREHIVAAILRDITFTQDSYNSFIDLQDKLHQTIGRKRSIVSIGTHDLDTIKGPFVYDAKPPSDIRFKPLNQTKEYTGEEIMELYAHHAQLKQYLPIIKDSPVYPIIYDSNGIVLSLPPIINGNHTKITLNTKNVLIECTATDLNKAKITVDTIVCAFSVYCAKRYTTETVKVIYPDNKIFYYPELNYRTEEINSDNAMSYIGIKKTPEEIAKLLSKMSLEASVKEKDNIIVEIPPTRSDVLHPCDIYEDIAIAHGYNNIDKIFPEINTIAIELPLNKLSDQLREELARASFTETLTFSLCSRDDISEKIGHKIEDIPAVHISNPKTLEFQVARTTLLPGLLKTIAGNKKMPLPLKLFEISDIVLLDPTMDVGARNKRHLCAVYYNKTGGFEIIHGLLDRIMQVLEVPWSTDKTDTGYYLRAADDPTFFPKRYAEVIYNNKVIGKMGILHPDVLTKFELNLPCSTLEIDIEPFL